MNRNKAKELLPIIEAFSEGRVIQSRHIKGGASLWYEVETPNFDNNDFDYRIKPEPKYRPFKDAEECWAEMLKHQPFGWVKEKYSGRYTLITEVNGLSVKAREGCRFIDGVIHYTFADDTPFGIKIE